MSRKYNLRHFYNYEPDNLTSINVIAINDDVKKIAVLRKSLVQNIKIKNFLFTSIEIWNFDFNNFFVESRIYDNYNDPINAESIAWGMNNRLFTVGLNEKLNEIDLTKNCIKNSNQVFSGPAYCMKFNKKKNLVLIGTEQGYICIYNINNNNNEEIIFEKTINASSRIFCLDILEKEEKFLIVTGTTEKIKIFDFFSGSCLDIIKITPNLNNVWCLSILDFEDEFIIVSGQSNGTVSFYDGNSCTEIISYQHHHQDVTSLCTNNKDFIFSVGIDGKICRYHFINGKIVIQGKPKNISEYDLKTIAYSEKLDSLFVGGTDTELKQTYCIKESLILYRENLQRYIQVCDYTVMYQYKNHLCIWYIDKTSNELLFKGKIISKKEILSSAISLNFVAFANYNRLKLLKRSNTTYTKININYFEIKETIEKLILTDENLFVQTATNIYKFKLDVNINSNNQSLNIDHQFNYRLRIHSFNISKMYIAVALSDNSILFYNLKTNVFLSNLTVDFLPLFADWKSNHIFHIFLTNKYFFVYDVQSGKTLNSDNLESFFNSKKKNIKNITFSGITFTMNSTVLYNLKQIISCNHDTNEIKTLNYDNTIKFGKFNEEEFYLIELPFTAITQQLPPKLKRKRFHSKLIYA